MHTLTILIIKILERSSTWMRPFSQYFCRLMVCFQKDPLEKLRPTCATDACLGAAPIIPNSRVRIV